MLNQEFFYSILPSLSEHPSPDSYIMKAFRNLLDTFCFSLAWKDNAIVHMSQAIAKEGIPTSTPLLHFHVDGGPVVSLSQTPL